MSLVDLARRLEQSFQRSARLLTKLLAGLQDRRTAWISARPQTIAPAADLESLAAQLRAEDEARTAQVAELSAVLPRPAGVRAQDLHVNVSRIAAALSPGAARSLRLCADEATAIATKVRRELALGTRLLGFAQRTHESLLANIATASGTDKTNCYDRNARTRLGLGKKANAGSLVDGRM